MGYTTEPEQLTQLYTNGEGATMTDRETLDKAKALFTGATQGDTLAREVIAIADRLIASEEARVASRVNEMLARSEELRRSIAKCKP